MPIYEYICRACGHELEALQRVSEEPLTDCPACTESQLRKKISAAGFRLKGGGWYETDFKDSGASKAKAVNNKADKDEDATKNKPKPESKTKSADSKDSAA